MNRMEELRIQQMLRLGCVACAYLEIVYPECEVHHLLAGNRRIGDWFTIPLCPGHHRGAWTREQELLMHEKQLVSIADGRKAFSKIYPIERELWERVQDRLCLSWPQSTKVLPRVVA